MSRIRNALTARDRLVWYLAMVVLVLGALLAHAHYRLTTVQTDFTMHVPPDVSQGATLKPDEPLPSSVYVYTLYIWKHLNEWLKNGTQDYKAAIEDYKCYVSPEFHGWLNRHYERERSSGALARTRTVSTKTFYTDDYVKAAGNGTWYIWLDLNLQERVAGEVVKDAVIRYPLYAYVDSRSCNKLGVAIGGFFADPERLSVKK